MEFSFYGCIIKLIIIYYVLILNSQPYGGECEEEFLGLVKKVLMLVLLFLRDLRLLVLRLVLRRVATLTWL